MNPFAEVNWRPGIEERRRFAASLVVGFPCVAVALLVIGRWHGGEWNWVMPVAVGGGGAGVGLGLWLIPQIALPFYVAWYAIACTAGWLIGNALLVAIYLLLFAPLGLARRAAGRPALSKGFDRNAATYWHDAGKPDDPERYYRQF